MSRPAERRPLATGSSRWRYRTAAQAAALTVASTFALPGCGGAAGDLLALEVTSGRETEPVRLTVTEDGRGTCDRDELEAIPSDLLIDARAVERELEGLAEEGASFGAGGTGDGRRGYVARTSAGTVRWEAGAAGVPEVLPRAELLAKELERNLCEP